MQADFADSWNSVYLPLLTQRLQQRFAANELRLHDLLADAGYSTGSNYAFLEQRGITPWIPVHGPYKPEIEGFPYDPVADHFTCPAGKQLPFQKYTTDPNRGWQKYYPLYLQQDKIVAEIGLLLGVGRATIYRYLAYLGVPIGGKAQEME